MTKFIDVKLTESVESCDELPNLFADENEILNADYNEDFATINSANSSTSHFSFGDKISPSRPIVCA